MSSLRVTEYWREIGYGIYFLNISLKKCLDAIHKDLVAIWNIRDMDGVRAREYLKCIFGFTVSL